MAEAGQRIGDYEILAQLGAGGMGRVYKVRNVISNREEAMKILLPDFAADEELAARFMAEIRTLATLEHPGIAQLRTAFQFQNQLVMIMEYVEGITLEKLASQIRIPQDHALDFASQVLAALSYAHSQGVTHRDIKPANIMVTTHGLVKLMDFGIAKSGEDMRLTRPGTTMGSVYYMSPEQVRGGTADARTDLYSLGVTMYEILTGRKPFQADTSYSVLDAQLNQAPTPLIEVNPAIPPALNAIVLKAMEKLPEDRFQTADEFRAALKGLRESAAAIPQAAAISQAAAASQAAVPVAQAAVPVAQPAMANAMPQAGPSAISNAGPVSPPPFTPVPQVAMPAQARARSHRGLWIGLGAGLALLALVAVATVLPHFLASHASPKQAASETQASAAAPAATPAGDTAAATASQPTSSQPASGAAAVGGQADAAPAGTAQAGSAQAGTVPAASGPAGSGQATSGHAASARAGSAHARPAYTGETSAAGGHAAGSAQGGSNAGAAASSSAGTSAAQGVGGGAAAAGSSPAELQAAQDRMGELRARSDAATAQIQQLRSQQQAMGMDLRGDILGAMNRLQFNMSQANRALNQNDVASANDYMKKAENSIEVLEKFLGR
jgi:serine/threonine-protein kinase